VAYKSKETRLNLTSQAHGINMLMMLLANNYHVLRHIRIFQSRLRINDKNKYHTDDSSKINIILICLFISI